MEKMNFILKNDDTIVCNEICDFEYNNEEYSFGFQDYNFVLFAIEDIFNFKRESKDEIFEINYYDNKIECFIYLKEYNLRMPVNIKFISYKFTQKSIEFSYEIISDEGVKKTIIISF